MDEKTKDKKKNAKTTRASYIFLPTNKHLIICIQVCHLTVV